MRHPIASVQAATGFPVSYGALYEHIDKGLLSWRAVGALLVERHVSKASACLDSAASEDLRLFLSLAFETLAPAASSHRF